MSNQTSDPIFSYFKNQQCLIEPNFIGNTGAFRGYKVSFESWYFIYLFEEPSTLNIIEFASKFSQGLQNATFSLVKTLQQLQKNIPQLRFISGSIVEASDAIEENRLQKMLAIFAKLGVKESVDRTGYPCLVYDGSS